MRGSAIVVRGACARMKKSITYVSLIMPKMILRASGLHNTKVYRKFLFVYMVFVGCYFLFAVEAVC